MTSFCMSLDGFVARPDDSVGPLFDWHTNGDVPVRPPGYPLDFRMSAASARYWEELIATMRDGAMVCGRRIFDHTRGWGGVAPLGVPAFVVTHRPAPQAWPPTPDARFTVVHEGIESAVAQAKAAGNGNVSVAGPNVAQQCLNAKLLDEVRIDLVPVLLSQGIRYFEKMDTGIAGFDRVEVVEGTGVTHLRYRVRYR